MVQFLHVKKTAQCVTLLTNLKICFCTLLENKVIIHTRVTNLPVLQ